ncbi:hypothetical protein [Sphingopyxis sp.]|uniref:hypothetical protein n=1 Tax=Sphingopyxis sp. TaxID=1908224 RepID=UPI002EDA9ED5
MKFKTAASMTALLLALSTGIAHAGEAITDPFDRADASFSRYPLNLPSTPQAIGRLANGDVCDDDEGIACEWEDDAGVRHIFAGETLAIKTVDAAALGDRDIGALNIGTARTRDEVLKKVRAFLPEIAIDCLEPGKAGEGAGIASCGGTFENGGWIKLLFGAGNRLTSARIDAFQID